MFDGVRDSTRTADVHAAGNAGDCHVSARSGSLLETSDWPGSPGFYAAGTANDCGAIRSKWPAGFPKAGT